MDPKKLEYSYEDGFYLTQESRHLRLFYYYSGKNILILALTGTFLELVFTILTLCNY